MKRRTIALLTAFLCAFTMMPLHGAAYPDDSGIITNIYYDKNGERSYYLIDGEYMFHQRDVELYYDGEQLECGDMVIVNCDNMDPIFPGGCNFVEGNSIEYVGKSAEPYEVVALTITGSEGIYAYAQDALKTEYEFIRYRFMNDPQPGDVLECVMIDGMPSYAVDVSPLGDVNDDSRLNILDVIALNKAILIGEPIPALENSENAAKSAEPDYGQCDFNGNGILDLDDSLGMMKRILKIEETAE